MTEINKEVFDQVTEEVQKFGQTTTGLKDQHDKLMSQFGDMQETLKALQTSNDPIAIEKAEKQIGDVLARQEGIEKAMTELRRPSMSNGTQDEAATEFKHARNFFQLTKSRRGEIPAGMYVKEADVDVDAYRAYKDAMATYLRKDDNVMGPTEMKALSVGSDPDGGYTVTPEMSQRIIERMFETSPIRQLATVETIGSNAMDLLEDPNEFTANWVGELETNGNTGTAQIGKRQIVAHQLEARPRASQQLLDDSQISIENWIAGKVSDKFVRTENNAFVVGNGVGKPRGLTTYAAGTDWGTIQQVNSGANGSVTYAGLVDLMYNLKEFYQGNASWLMRRELVGKVMGLSGNDTPLWIPSISVGQPSTLLGAPVRMAQDLATLATGSLSCAFGDFRAGYTIVDRMGVRILRNPYTATPNVEFYTTKRVGGDVADFDAIKLLKLSA